MSNIGSYTSRSFSENQKFLVLDPSTGTTSLVLGSDLVSYITPQLNAVNAESTRLAAENTDYAVGEIIQTAGATAPGDNFAAVYLVVEGGTGDFPMINGNDLLVIRGDEFLREQLIDNTAGVGSDLVAHTGTADTVTEALDKRVIRVSSVSEIESYSLPAGYQFSLEDGGASGHFDVISGDFSTELADDTYNAIYVGLSDDPTALTKVAKRRFDEKIYMAWYRLTGLSSEDATPAFVHAYNVATPAGKRHIFIEPGTYKVSPNPRNPLLSDTTIEWADGASMIAGEDSGSDISAMLEIVSVQNIKLINPVIVGDVDFNPLTTEGAGHCIDVRGVDNLTILNGNISKGFTDGIYLLRADNTYILNTICSDNGRQGISVISGENIRIEHPICTGSFRVPPKAGMDIEPNSGDTKLRNVVVNNLYTADCDGGGFICNLRGTDIDVDVTVNNHIDEGSIRGAALQKYAGTFKEGAVFRYNNGVSKNSQTNGIDIVWTDGDALLEVNNPSVYSPNTSNGTNERRNDVGISLHSETSGYPTGTALGNVTIRNPTVKAAAARPLLRGLYIGFNESYNNVKVIDPLIIDIGNLSTIGNGTKRTLIGFQGGPGENVVITDKNKVCYVEATTSLFRDINSGFYSRIKSTYTAGAQTVRDFGIFGTMDKIILIAPDSAFDFTVEFPSTASRTFVDDSGSVVSTSAVSATPEAVLILERLRDDMWRVSDPFGTWTIT